jgi:hypothetical protein
VNIEKGRVRKAPGRQNWGFSFAPPSRIPEPNRKESHLKNGRVLRQLKAAGKGGLENGQH